MGVYNDKWQYFYLMLSKYKHHYVLFLLTPTVVTSIFVLDLFINIHAFMFKSVYKHMENKKNMRTK